MSPSIPSVSPLRGVPSLELHGPSPPFTHHEEKIQNMWCASLILSCVYAVIFFISFFLHPPKPDILTAPPQNKENLATFPEGIQKYCSLNTDVDIFDSGRTFAKMPNFQIFNFD